MENALTEENGKRLEEMVERRPYAAFHELPLSDIEPQGWLRTYLERQRDGLTGHLDEVCWPWNTGGWAAEIDKKVWPGQDTWWAPWWPYEQTGYWVDGMIRCGRLLNDDFLVEKAREQIEHVLNHPTSDGLLGPKHTGDARWHHAVFFRALMAEVSASGDREIVEAMHQHYLADGPMYGEGRNTCNVEQLCWLYEQTGDRRLLKLARESYAEFDATGNPLKSMGLRALSGHWMPYEHGVTFLELAKLPAILYTYTGEDRLLDAAVNGFHKLDAHHMLIDGVPSSDEFFNGKAPARPHETCDIADYTWATGYLLQATGDAAWADRIERACLNAGIGAVTEDFTAHQYLSSPNQAIATSQSNYGDQVTYRPSHVPQCCSGEINRIMPNYVARMWLSDGAGGVVAALYGPSTVRAAVGEGGEPVTIVETTDYPFSERIEFEVQAERPVRFPLWLRIPGWCEGATVEVNGQLVDGELRPGSFFKLERPFAPGDRVVVTLPMELKMTRWPQGGDFVGVVVGVGLERGPLVYALSVKEERERNTEVVVEPQSTDDYPAWDMRPVGPWNYALAVDDDSLDDVEVVESSVMGFPWSIDSPPIQLRVPARRVGGWELARKTVDGEERVHTPDLPVEPTFAPEVEGIALVPYGCTLLRMTIFPQCKG